VDAPVHFIKGGTGVDQIGFHRLIGPARVIDVSGAQAIEVRHLEKQHIRAHDRVLLKTRNSQHWKERAFRTNYTFLSTEAARWLVERDVWTIGIDYLSIAGMEFGPETHRVLLSVSVCIIEGLDLSRIEPGEYDLVCLPLRLVGLDGAPARVILRPRQTEGGV
jgi:arylformamidase